MKYIYRERNSNEDIITESSSALNFFYGNFFGRILLKIMTTKLVSNIIACYMNSKFSVKKIEKFVEKNNINTFEYESKNYKSYNEFFTRKVIPYKRPIDSPKDRFVSPCDSKVIVYDINKDLTLKIKDSYYSIDSLVNDNIIEDYVGGYAFVFRLSVDNYHRYCFVDSGTKEEDKYIKGIFHTVQPISLKRYNFFKTNSREYTILHTKHFGDVIQVEIGAMGVGRIKNDHSIQKFKKGDEKGYFEFGGSTIVVLVKKNVLTVDKDIMDNSKDNIETIVKYGEGIAKNTLFTKIVNIIKLK